MSDRLNFTLPAGLRAAQPPEARGLGRDGVRMMVATGDGQLVDSEFGSLPCFLTPEDLVVINTSATLPAAVTGADVVTGSEVVVHLSTWLGARGGPEIWVVEPRRPTGLTTKRWAGPRAAGQRSPPARAPGRRRRRLGAPGTVPGERAPVDGSAHGKRSRRELAGRARPAHPL